jgi:hypothetical protein
MGSGDRSRVRRLIGVYDANGTIRGELMYWVKARLGVSHCALCDITHGRAGERADWRSCRDRLPVAFDVYHRDDQADSVRRASGDTAPVVLAETSDGLVLLLSPSDLVACNSSPEDLVAKIESAMTSRDLEWESIDPQ